jgi:hypothetical protein
MRILRSASRKLCECGCGAPTALSDRTWAKHGMVKGQPLRFVKGHNPVNNLNLIGQKFGRLTIISNAPSKNGKSFSICECDCENTCIKQSSLIASGKIQSCGCLSSGKPRHGMSNKAHPFYSAWVSMNQRVNDPNATNFEFYGGRGITICMRWQTFENFRNDMQESWFAGGSLDRINNEGNYEPSNCKWSSKKEQARNRRSTNTVEAFGETMSLAEAVERFAVVGYGVVRQRIYRQKWSVEEALITPPKQ